MSEHSSWIGSLVSSGR